MELNNPPLLFEDGPPPPLWRTIIDAALAIHESDPWSNQHAAYPFGVEDPVTGEIGYCLFQRHGSGQDDVLVKVLRGEVGLGVWRDVLNQAANNAAAGPFLDPNAAQQFLSIAWMPADRLTSNDRALLRELDWALEPSGVYPVFRAKAMGYAPWSLSREDGRFLAVVLEQALAVLPRSYGSEGLVMPDAGAEEHVLIRRLRACGGESPEWVDTWAVPAFPGPDVPSTPLDQVAVRRIEANVEQGAEMWEVLAQPVSLVAAEPAPIHGAPYHPVVLMAVDATRNTLLDAATCEFDQWPAELHAFLLTLMEKLRTRPAAISAFPSLEAQALGALCKALNIDLVTSSRQPLAERAWRRFRQQMSGQGV